MLLTATTVDLSEAEHWNSALFIIQWGAGSSSLASGKETFCIVTQQWMKCKCWGSPKGFHFACHALAVTELESVVWSVAPCVAVGTRLLKPNGCQMYGARWLCRVLVVAQKNHRPHTVHTNWHRLMSHTIASKGNYIHLNLSDTSTKKGQRKMCLPWIYSQMKTAKTKVGHVQVITDTLYSRRWEQHVGWVGGRGGRCRGGGHNLCPAYLYDTRLWNGKIKGKLFGTKCELCFCLFVIGRLIITTSAVGPGQSEGLCAITVSQVITEKSGDREKYSVSCWQSTKGLKLTGTWTQENKASVHDRGIM